MLNQISDFLVKLLEQTGLLGVFFATAIESFFAPIPSEIVLFTAGFYASQSQSYLLLIVLCAVGAFGNYMGTLPFYLISRFGREKFLEKFINRFGRFLLISMNGINKAECLFKKRGNAVVFFARLVPGIRSLIAFPAGAFKMNFLKYSFFTLLGSFVWNMILSTLGFVAYNYKTQIFDILRPIETTVIILIILAVLIYVLNVVIQIIKYKRNL